MMQVTRNATNKIGSLKFFYFDASGNYNKIPIMRIKKIAMNKMRQSKTILSLLFFHPKLAIRTFTLITFI